MADVLTSGDLRNAMDALLNAPPVHVRWYGPPWAKDALMAHGDDALRGDHVVECPECSRAWAAMTRG